MTTEQFNELVRQDIDRVLRSRSSRFQCVFEWDQSTGFSCERVNYDPIDVTTASSWIVPGTIEEEEPYPEDVYHYEEGEVV